MKVFIKNKLISLGGSSEVKNEQGEPVFTVKGKFISPTKKKKMYDMQGNLLYVIRNRYWNFLYNKTFVYDANNIRVATVKKNKWSVTRKFEIEDTPDAMSIEGKFFGLTSKILRNETQVGTITREITLVRDSFALEADEKDIAFLTALVVAFDNLQDKRQKDND